MVNQRMLTAALAVLAASLLACSGGTSGGTGASAAEGGGGNGTSSGTGGAGASTSSAGGALSCDGLDQDACLDAPESCAPLYDDDCCPSCQPGECKDCQILQFYRCLSRDEACSAKPPSCGVVPDWACPAP